MFAVNRLLASSSDFLPYFFDGVRKDSMVSLSLWSWYDCLRFDQGVSVRSNIGSSREAQLEPSRSSRRFPCSCTEGVQALDESAGNCLHLSSGSVLRLWTRILGFMCYLP